jgi:FkbM family methyltransferase
MFTDNELLDIYVKMQEKNKPEISIEIGAFDADFSKSMVPICKNIYAFEASPFVYRKFKNDMQGINYINKAVSDKNEKIKFKMIGNLNFSDIGHNSIKDRVHQTDIKIAKIDSITINSYFKDYNNNTFTLWIDCEGSNKEVLTGASDILKQTQTILIETEIEPIWKNQWLHNDVCIYLNSFGFDLYLEKESGDLQKNCIFVNHNLINL